MTAESSGSSGECSAKLHALLKCASEVFGQPFKNAAVAIVVLDGDEAELVYKFEGEHFEARLVYELERLKAHIVKEANERSSDDC